MLAEAGGGIPAAFSQTCPGRNRGVPADVEGQAALHP